MKNFKRILSGAAFALALSATAQVTVNLDLASRGPVISPTHYGIFFEEINHAGDGGLYAELVRNRSFEDNDASPEYWTAVGSASLSLTNADLLEGNAYALRAEFKAAGDGFSNPGYWGINAVEGRTYQLSFYVRGPWKGVLTASLNSASGTALGSATVGIDCGKEWTRYTATITATASDPKASLRLTASQSGTLDFDCISLFPPTYKNRPNGCRIDLAEKLEAMHPAFMRFPGGCYVEGTNSGTGHNRFEWKKTVGPIENRPGHWNQNWGYRVTDGFGFHEMLQLAEDLGAEPLYVVNIGLGHYWSVPYNEIGSFIQEALDAIEYCNGDVTTTYGALRAANGHPEPFNLRLVEIGNENYQGNVAEQSDHYAERYKQFYDAIKALHPEITLIGNVESWGTDTPSWRNNYPCEVVDEHYYRTPEWFVSQYAKYDGYSRSLPKVYAGEYAVTSGFGTRGHLTAALGEATYMLGMERNSDIVIMNSYAPIFVNENDQRWMPDMIRFNSAESYGTPSYHVQQLMSTLHGHRNILFTEEANRAATALGHKVGFSSWSTDVTYDNMRVTDASGAEIFADDFSAGKEVWSSTCGTWTISSGALRQTDASMQGALYMADIATPESFTIEVDATKNSGAEGFLVAFNVGDDRNYIWWNIGGWNNTTHALQVASDGVKTDYDSKAGTIVTGRTYHIKIQVEGSSIRCWLDNDLIHDFRLPTRQKLYLASALSEDNQTLYVKVVNNDADAQTLTLTAKGGSFVSEEDVTVLASASGSDENSTTEQTLVAPASGSMESVEAGKAVYQVPPHSLSIIRLKVSDIEAPQPSAAPSADDLQAVEDFLNPLKLKLSNLHATTTLPVSTPAGGTIAWSYSGSPLTLTSSRWSAELNVTAPAGKTATDAGTLKATVTYPGGETSTHDMPVRLAPADEGYGYLYCYMSNDKEVTNFALGTKEDLGKKFTQLLGGDEIFDTQALAQIEHGTRDAFMGRGERGEEFFITTTDMCNATSGQWNNYGINLLRSVDLIHWEGTTFDFRKGRSIFSDPEANTGVYTTDEEYAKINRVWAPQWLWWPEANGGQGAYLVYYSILSSNPGDTHDRIFYSLADRDFKTLTQPRLLYDPGYAVIDADITFNPYDGLWHLCIKHNEAEGSDRGIHLLKSDKLIGGEWTEYDHMDNEGLELVEAPTLMRRLGEDAYNLYYVRYTNGIAYRVSDADHLADHCGDSADLDGTGAFQHGSMTVVTEEEYGMLQAWSRLYGLMKDAKASGSSAYAEALAAADAALSNTSIATLAEELPKAIELMLQAREKAIGEQAGADGSADLTPMLQNPTFASNGNGWEGTEFTAVNAGVAEHWNKVFDTYQTLTDMPAGTYTFSCSGFYRYGGKWSASVAHTNGTEKILAELYANSAAAPFMSLYDSSTSYTASPYNFPDNVWNANDAFNTKKFYGDNKVTVKLDKRGDLRLGIRKSEPKYDDWTCFDNFRLTYVADDSAIDEIYTEVAGRPADVYNVAGICVLRQATAADLRSLQPGIYIISGRKYILR